MRPEGPYVRDVRRSYVREQYPAWLRNNRPNASDLRRMREEASNFGYKPLISILLPIRDARQTWLKWTLDSMLGQAYPHWELCAMANSSEVNQVLEIISLYRRLDSRIKIWTPNRGAGVSTASNAALAATEGEFVVLLNQDDELSTDALFEVVKLLQEHPEAALVYSDEDKIDAGGNRFDPYFKPGWSPDLLLSTNYVGHLGAYRKSILEEAGGFQREFDGSQYYDMTLRFTEKTDEIYHVPKVLYQRRTVEGFSSDTEHARDSILSALSEALERRDLQGSVEGGSLSNHFRVKLQIQGEPKVSVIIPTRDNVSLLKNCVESIERLTSYRNYDILIVDNDSDDPATVGYLSSTPHRVIRFREEFNYSKINNFAAGEAEGEYLLFLNDDTEVIAERWMEEMLGHAQRKEVGAVGAKLLYPDGRIQHAGVLTGVGNVWGLGVATHSHQFYSADSPGYGGAATIVGNYAAVTAACMMVRRSKFEEVGSFDEKNLPISFNDVDLCLRMRERGYRIIYTPYAELYHHESASRGRKSRPAENIYMREYWGEVLDNDPFYNANFSRGSGDFNLRADMLRPQILRMNLEGPKARKVPYKQLHKMHGRELRSYIEKMRERARDSDRVALVVKTTSG